MAEGRGGISLNRGGGGGGGGGYGGYGGGGRQHKLMVPPPGYKFIPKREKVCGEAGCFECYDIYCERCESKDRRIIELEMRNTDLVKHLTLLQERLFKKDGGRGGGAAGAGSPGQGGDGFAYVESPVLYDPSLQLQYQARTTFHQVGAGGAGGSPSGGGGGGR
mmetsp:Transcript_21497/g.46729  ORF Transcript_21497/g.46729 Transcript_21497/m.46729 type:complete len:163 (-) Transcript_21497:29-517(-)|eukprot:CAMPEP_0206490618 /NCGR_PEP_ID=MMETSP0324_2-20121206/44256_1 /ASSEMBLY_ACC=CAM_ASM_000836 /TAXON_ID=2866 /ORGANISM="Crypthecodinium cohnii, Strain Seligo" /LENGTH=162 /DNA_ID=CAMNT_0053971149 /DNA_START=159 /DNA_END=647 /DNA_ORIENTATION=-